MLESSAMPDESRPFKSASSVWPLSASTASSASASASAAESNTASTFGKSTDVSSPVAGSIVPDTRLIRDVNSRRALVRGYLLRAYQLGLRNSPIAASTQAGSSETEANVTIGFAAKEAAKKEAASRPAVTQRRDGLPSSTLIHFPPAISRPKQRPVLCR